MLITNCPVKTTVKLRKKVFLQATIKLRKEMNDQSTCTITVLLATVLCAMLMTAKACPLPSNCSQDQCQAYKDAKAATSPMYLNVNATLNDFTNTPDEFNQKLGTDYELDSIEGTGQACYKLTNQEKGCREIMEVEGGNCSWIYLCDYDDNRLPLYIWRASCSSESQTIYYPVPVLKRRNACNPQPTWQLFMEKVPVGCKC